MWGILIALAIVVVGILVAAALMRRPANPANPAYPVPPLGLLNPGGGWIAPINGDQAVQRGCRVVAMSTPNYSYQMVEPAQNITIGSNQAAIVGYDQNGVRMIGGTSRQDLIHVGP